VAWWTRQFDKATNRCAPPSSSPRYLFLSPPPLPPHTSFSLREKDAAVPTTRSGTNGRNETRVFSQTRRVQIASARARPGNGAANASTNRCDDDDDDLRAQSSGESVTIFRHAGIPFGADTLREFARRQRVRRELRRDACINHAGSNNAGA